VPHPGRASVRVVIFYETGKDGGVVASIPAVCGVHSQGRRGEEARAIVMRATRAAASRHQKPPAALAAAADLVIGLGGLAQRYPAGHSHRERAVGGESEQLGERVAVGLHAESLHCDTALGGDRRSGGHADERPAVADRGQR
jgi:hypothetical protein